MLPRENTAEKPPNQEKKRLWLARDLDLRSQNTGGTIRNRFEGFPGDYDIISSLLTGGGDFEMTARPEPFQLFPVAGCAADPASPGPDGTTTSWASTAAPSDDKSECF